MREDVRSIDWENCLKNKSADEMWKDINFVIHEQMGKHILKHKLTTNSSRHKPLAKQGSTHQGQVEI